MVQKSHSAEKPEHDFELSDEMKALFKEPNDKALTNYKNQGRKFQPSRLLRSTDDYTPDGRSPSGLKTAIRWVTSSRVAVNAATLFFLE